MLVRRRRSGERTLPVPPGPGTASRLIRSVRDPESNGRTGPLEEQLPPVDDDTLDEPVLPLAGPSASTVVAIFLGGAVGTMARYLLAAHHPLAAGDFPWVTLLVNLSGSFAIGLVMPLTQRVSPRLSAA